MPKKPRQVEGVYEKSPGSGVWYTRLRVNGKLVRKAIGTRQQAIEYIEKARTLRRTGEGVVPMTAKLPARYFSEIDKAGSDLTVGQLCDQWLKHIQDEKNPERLEDQDNPPTRVKAIKRAFGDRPAASLRPYEIKDWLISLGHAPATLNRYKSTLSAVYKYAKMREQIVTNPVRDVPHFKIIEKLPRWMSDAEEDSLRAVIQRWIDKTPREHKVTRLLLREHLNEITVGSQTGMRKGNEYALRWEDVDFDLRLIMLPDTKPGIPHVVAMTDDVHEALLDQKKIQAELKELRGDGYESSRLRLDGRVFVIEENREWFAKAKKEAKVKNLGWHQLSRHTAGSRLGMANASLRTIQEVLGHATPTMSAKYTHLSKEHLANSMKALNRKKK